MTHPKPSRNPPRTLGIAAAAAALVLDQATKYWMLHVYDVAEQPPLHVAPFLDVLLSWNRGVSYSLLPANGEIARYALLGLQLAIIAVIALLLRRARHWASALGFGLIVGGALGNAADRLFRGAVADFFYLHTELPVGPLANYVFNVADAFITLGVVFVLFEQLFAPQEAQA